MATGTFQLDNQIFPKDPLTKNWIRPPVAVGGNRKTLFGDRWALQLNFGALETTTEHNFFWQKYIAGGLYNAVLPHPANGKLFAASGVAIDSYEWTWDDVGPNSHAINPRMTLSGPDATVYTIPDWYNQNYAYRAPTVISTSSPSGTVSTGDTLRFYASGSVAQNIFNKSAVSDGKDVRVVWAQEQQELARDLRIWSTNVIEILWRAQESQLTTIEEAGQYYIYYGNPQAVNPPEKYGQVYNWYTGIESGNLIDFNTASTLGHTASKDEIFAGQWALKANWGAGLPDTFGATHALARLNFVRAEITLQVYVDTLTMPTQRVRFGFNANGAYRAGVALDENLDIYFSGVSDVDTGANLIASQWNKFEIEAIAPVTGTGKVRLNNLPIHSGGTFAPTTDIDGFISTFSVTSNPEGGTFLAYFDEIKFRKVARIEPSISLDTEEALTL